MNRKGNNAPIGVFDSGLGGLTVLKELISVLPDEDVVYFGDTARVPYGSKSKDTIIHYTKQILAFLKTKEVKAIVTACNTVSAYALEEVASEVPVPIIGVVKPGAEVAAKKTKNGRIGVIGTKATVESGLYRRCILENNRGLSVYQKACPLFVPLVEEGLWEDDLTEAAAERYLSELKEQDVDTLIMGCTHYPLIRSVIRHVMGETVTLVNPAHETARRMKEILEEKTMCRDPFTEPSKTPYRFYVSDGPENFREFASRILNVPLPLPEQIDIEAFS